MKTTLIVALSLLVTNASWAGPKKGNDPCEQIREACENAKFVKNTAKQGTGLWEDCINPILQGTTSPKAKLPLPTVSADTVAACHSKHPKFGEGKVAK